MTAIDKAARSLWPHARSLLFGSQVSVGCIGTLVLPCVTLGSLVLPCVTLGSLVLPCVTLGSLVLPCVTLGSLVLPCVTLGSLVLPCVTLGSLILPRLNLVSPLSHLLQAAGLSLPGSDLDIVILGVVDDLDTPAQGFRKDQKVRKRWPPSICGVIKVGKERERAFFSAVSSIASMPGPRGQVPPQAGQGVDPEGPHSGTRDIVQCQGI